MASKKQELVVEVTTKADQAKRELAQLDKAAKDLEGKPIEVPVDVKGTESTKAKLDTLERSTSGAKNAFANLVGNTAQDLGNLGGPLGSVGVAVGQVAEYTADAANEGGGLTAALKGAASMAGPLVALSAAGFAVTKVLGDMKKQAEEAKAANDAFLRSMVEGTGIVENWAEALDDAFSEGTTDNVQDLNKFLKDTLSTTGDLEETTTAFGQLGLTVDDLGPAIAAADDNFASFAKNLLLQRGYSEQAAEAMTWVVDNNEKLGDVLKSVGPMVAKFLTPEQAAQAENYARGLAQVKDIVEKLDTEQKAKEFNDLARAIPGMAEAVDRARASSLSERDAALQVNDALQEQTTRRAENARAQEEGARAAQESGTILDQVGRQVEQASQLAADAMTRAKRAQDAWLLGTVDAQAEVDDVTSAIGRLKDITDKQAEATAAGTQTTKEKIEADIAQRDAMAAITREGVDVVQSYKDQGLTADQARAKQADLAQQQYQLAIAMSFPEEAAARIRDNILAIPPSVTSDVQITEQGYADVKAKKDALQKDTESTHYIYGVLDRSVANAIANLPPGSIPGSGRAATPAGGPVAVPLGVAPLAAPQAVSAPSRAVSVHVNMTGAIVADTFQLQRVVSRAVRQGVRLNGARRYG